MVTPTQVREANAHIRYVEFRGGRFLARLFLTIEPIVGLRRAERLMAWLITHRPFVR